MIVFQFLFVVYDKCEALDSYYVDLLHACVYGHYRYVAFVQRDW